MNIDYKKAYNIYKKLPQISFVITMILALAWGIIDWAAYITELAELGFGGLVIWLLAGTVLAAINLAFSAILISPTIVRTDATLAILGVINNNASASPKATSVSSDELPEL